MTYGGAISGDVWSTSSVTLTRNYDNPTDTYVRGPTCASVMPACCYECDDRGLRVPSDPLDAALCGLLTNILNGESIKNALKGVFINTSDRHLFESTITSVDTNRQ
jgi:hypothetical protein